MNDKVKKQYFLRKSGIIVCLKDETALYYLNPECEWIRNQEWYVSMFVDGDDDDYTEISESQVMAYINDRLNSSIDLNTSKKTR